MSEHEKRYEQLAPIVKDRILHNQFAFELRVRDRIDAGLFLGLCKDLNQVAAAWKRVGKVEKEVVASIYLIMGVVWSMEGAMRSDGHANLNSFASMREELDELVEECLSGTIAQQNTVDDADVEVMLSNRLEKNRLVHVIRTGATLRR